MDGDLCASLVVDDCSTPCVCENVSMSVYLHDCDDMLLESLGVVDIPNDKLLKKKARKFQKNLSKLFCEMDDLIAKLNESNKLVEKYKKLAENSLEKLKEFECLNMDLDAKLALSNKLVDELKCENESLKMHAKCLIAEPIAKNDENVCCNHVVVPDFMPIVCYTSKDKSVYIPSHKRNQKVERKAVKSRPPFRSQPKVLDGFKFVPTCHHCSVNRLLIFCASSVGTICGNRLNLCFAIYLSWTKCCMVRRRSMATSPSHQESRNAFSHLNRTHQSTPVMQPPSTQQLQSMAATMAELTCRNQGLT